jgi:hypothetical protein
MRRQQSARVGNAPRRTRTYNPLIKSHLLGSTPSVSGYREVEKRRARGEGAKICRKAISYFDRYMTVSMSEPESAL